MALFISYSFELNFNKRRLSEPSLVVFVNKARHLRAYHHQNTDGFTLGDRLIPICFVKRVLLTKLWDYTPMYNTIPCMSVIVF